jgi:hypothetical protein
VESLSGLIPGYGPEAVAIERVAFGVLGQVVGAAHSIDTAAAANGINVTFDAQMVADIKALVAKFPDVIAQAEQVFGVKAK